MSAAGISGSELLYATLPPVQQTVDVEAVGWDCNRADTGWCAMKYRHLKTLLNGSNEWCISAQRCGVERMAASS